MSGGRKKRRQMDALFGHHEARRSIDMRRQSQELINNSESSREPNLRLEVAGDDDDEFFATQKP